MRIKHAKMERLVCMVSAVSMGRGVVRRVREDVWCVEYVWYVSSVEQVDEIWHVWSVWLVWREEQEYYCCWVVRVKRTDHSACVSSASMIGSVGEVW